MIRKETKNILSELIKSTTNQDCPFLVGNEGDTIGWYEHCLKNTNIKLFKEGLVKTYPFDFTIQRLGKYGLVKLIANKIYLGLNKEHFKNIKGLIKYLNTLGYFASIFKVLEKNQEVKPENYKSFNSATDVVDITDNAQQIWIEIEAKYDKPLNKNSLFFYHLTSKKNLNKIKHQGLIPKSKSKKSYHPHRIYIVDEINSLKELLVQFSEIEEKEVSDYVVLKIDYNLTNKPKIYNDPNFLNLGYYFVENIPPCAIIDIIEAVEILK
jgi:hypothetical protein